MKEISTKTIKEYKELLEYLSDKLNVNLKDKYFSYYAEPLNKYDVYSFKEFNYDVVQCNKFVLFISDKYDQMYIYTNKNNISIESKSIINDEDFENAINNLIEFLEDKSFFGLWHPENILSALDNIAEIVYFNKEMEKTSPNNIVIKIDSDNSYENYLFMTKVGEKCNNINILNDILIINHNLDNNIFTLIENDLSLKVQLLFKSVNCV